MKTIEIICKTCLTKFVVQHASVKRYTNKYGEYHNLCRKCLSATKLSPAHKEWWTSERRKTHQDRMAIDWTNIERKEKLSNSIKLLWGDTEYKEKMTRFHKSNKHKKSTISRSLWGAQGFRDKVVTAVNNARYTDEFIKKQSDASKLKWLDPDFRYRITMASIRNWCSDDYRQKIARAGQPRLSKIHKIVMDLLQEMGIEYKSEYVIGPWSFDIHIGCKKLLIEVNGDWIHSQPQKQKSDRAKATYIGKYHQDYELKYLWEHEFYIDGAVKSLLAYWCGHKYDTIDFDFNEVNIKQLNYDETSLFIGKYHYLGSIGRRGQYIGALVGGQLVATAVFSQCGRKEVATSIGLNYNDTYELTRFCIHPSYHKKNFASWLLSRIVKLVDKPWLVAFADLTHNHYGTIYKATNWNLVSIVAPDYWYVNKDGWVMHKKTLWNRASNLKMTEAQFAEAYNFIKRWGREKYKYLYDNRNKGK